MNAKIVAICLALAALPAGAQQGSTAPQDGISDVGAFEQVPYQLEPQLILREPDKASLRKLEDKHIAELRAIEDRFAKDLRTLRTKQQSEREAMLKSFAGRR